MKKLHLFPFLAVIVLISIGCEKKKETTPSSYKFDTFVEPYLNWGASMTETKTWYEETNSYKYLGYATQDPYIIIQYDKRKKETTNMIYFSLNSYWCACVYINKDVVSDEEILGFLSERYTYISTSNNIMLYRTKDDKTDVELSIETYASALHYRVVYSAKS